MELSVVGLSHKTAPVEIRERLALSGDTLRDALERWASGPSPEAMILSTCNRVEVVSATSEDSAIVRFLSGLHQVPEDTLVSHLYRYRGADAVRHVFRVASSLDSMVVGEPQILGQVKEAFRIASDVGTVGSNLSSLMNSAFATAKRVRNETGIAQSAVSVSYAAVELAKKIFNNLGGRAVMVIGASKMGDLTAQHLRRNGVGKVLVTNRTFDRAVELARVFDGAAVPFEHFQDHLDNVDIVITSTGAPHFIITKQDAERVAYRRRNRPIFFIDIAVPRNVDPDANQLDNVFVYDIDDLQNVVQANIQERAKEARRAEQIIDHEVIAFCRRSQTRDVVPTILEIRETLESLRKEEIDRFRKHLKNMTPEQQATVDQITQSLINKILHHPITHLKDSAHTNEAANLVGLMRRIFNVKPQ